MQDWGQGFEKHVDGGGSSNPRCVQARPKEVLFAFNGVHFVGLPSHVCRISRLRDLGSGLRAPLGTVETAIDQRHPHTLHLEGHLRAALSLSVPLYPAKRTLRASNTTPLHHSSNLWPRSRLSLPWYAQ
jgi:hypothetical protein